MSVDTELQQALIALRDTLPTVTPAIHTDQILSYTKEIALQIVEQYAQGISLHAISKMPGMPRYTALLDWSKNKPEFRAALSAMREIRALHFEDAAILAAESVEDPKEVPAARLKSETYWKAAEVNDPTRYGKKVTHAGDAAHPIQIVVSTGWTEPLNEYQRSPTLGADGLIERAVVVEAEVSDAEEPKETHEPAL